MAATAEIEAREPRAEKVAVVAEVRSRLTAANATILTEYRGLSVARMAELRRLLDAAGGEYKVYKNTLVRRAAHETGLESLDPLLEGPTAVAFVSGDVAAVAKVLRDFARTNPALVVKGGLIGTSVLDARSTSALAELPSREVLLAQLAGMLAAPMQRFAGLLAAVPSKMAYGLAALIDAKGGAPAPSDTAEPGADTAEPADAAAPTAEIAEAASAAAEPVADAAATGDQDAESSPETSAPTAGDGAPAEPDASE